MKDYKTSGKYHFSIQGGRSGCVEKEREEKRLDNSSILKKSSTVILKIHNLLVNICIKICSLVQNSFIVLVPFLIK